MDKDAFTNTLIAKCIELHGKEFERILKYGYSRNYVSYPYWIVLYETIDKEDLPKYEGVVNNLIRNMEVGTLEVSYKQFKRTSDKILNITLEKTFTNQKLVEWFGEKDYMTAVLKYIQDNPDSALMDQLKSTEYNDNLTNTIFFLIRKGIFPMDWLLNLLSEENKVDIVVHLLLREGMIDLDYVMKNNLISVENLVSVSVDSYNFSGIIEDMLVKLISDYGVSTKMIYGIAEELNYDMMKFLDGIILNQV